MRAEAAPECRLLTHKSGACLVSRLRSNKLLSPLSVSSSFQLPSPPPPGTAPLHAGSGQRTVVQASCSHSPAAPGLGNCVSKARQVGSRR
ncbi:unnamed protein product [Rangifer tarandus platyrhynchus]|uniref:Uncharacterized protein n=1 Tax=Rangifer tarandus platyrhynchus TaxID=3082113 RepID=A0AC60A6L7_RANTA